METRSYAVQCWSCLGEFDAIESVWCSCNIQSPTKLCPFCLQCFCQANPEYHERFWAHAPDTLQAEWHQFTEITDPLAELLIRTNLISTEQLLQAITEQQKTGQELSEVLVALDFVEKEDISVLIERQSTPTRVDLLSENIDEKLLEKLGIEFCIAKRVLPIESPGGEDRKLVRLVTAHSLDVSLLELVKNKTGAHVFPLEAPEEMILECLTRYCSEEVEEESTERPGLEELTPNDVFLDALRRRSSDIYFEGEEDRVSVRYRIDGVLYENPSMTARAQPTFLDDLKALLQLEDPISEPVKKRLVLRFSEKDYTLFVHAFEDQRVRIETKLIQKGAFPRALDGLGLPAQEHEQLRSALDEESGLIILSGPPLNGVGTTFYACLQQLASQDRRICTLEREFYALLPNVKQRRYLPNEESSFFEKLEQTLHDYPKALMITDGETKVKLGAAFSLADQLLVILGFEADGAAHVLQRLLAAGISPDLMEKHLRLLINQRLVRKLCPDCSQSASVPKGELKRLQLQTDDIGSTVKAVKGCQRCDHLGYLGRVAIFEALQATPALCGQVTPSLSRDSLQRIAIACGMTSLRQRCLASLAAGVTSLQEFEKGRLLPE